MTACPDALSSDDLFFSLSSDISSFPESSSDESSFIDPNLYPSTPRFSAAIFALNEGFSKVPEKTASPLSEPVVFIIPDSSPSFEMSGGINFQ